MNPISEHQQNNSINKQYIKIDLALWEESSATNPYIWVNEDP